MWWRGHRRIVSDYLIARGETVLHIMAHRVEPAHLTAGAVIRPDGTIVYPDAGDDATAPGQPRPERIARRPVRLHGRGASRTSSVPRRCGRAIRLHQARAHRRHPRRHRAAGRNRPGREAPTGDASATPPSELPYATISAAGQLFVSSDTGMPAIDASAVSATAKWQTFPNARKPS